jgi:PAS domain S-box-containing protein
MFATTAHHTATCLNLVRAVGRSHSHDEIFAAALDALDAGLGVTRSSILLFDRDGVMRFKASRGLSQTYRQAVEGHTPWQPDTPDPQPICVADVAADPALAPFAPVFAAEGIAALAFIPLTSLDRVIGKFMLYYGEPTRPSGDDLQLASVLAAQVAFAIARTEAELNARRNEERLRFALDAASMGTWDWDLATNKVAWSDNLATIHGLPEGSFDGTFASYAREIHPEDRDRVFASVRRALAEGVPHDVEYRLVAPDGTIRWCLGKGRVEYDDDRAVRMSGICMMITSRKEAELARLGAAEEANQVKDEFLATLSHELRTPLGAILGWTQMLQSGELSPGHVRQAIEVISRNARLQAQLIEDILDVSRIITGKLEIMPAPVSPTHLVETVLAAIAPAAEARRIRVGCDFGPDLPPLQADMKRLLQVLNNVLANAVKFTPEGGTVSLRCAVEGERLILSVQDTGVGVAPEFLPFMFDRFRQADSRSTRSHGGLGLGLSIARHIVEQHGGTIGASSDGPDRGTTITIALPVGAADERNLPASSAIADIRLTDTVALVVDDHDDSRDVVAVFLERHGVRVTSCDSAEAALDLLQRTQFDVLIADIAMPGMDGHELITRVRERGLRLPAIALTAFARPTDRQRAIDAGYTAYLAKPVESEALARLVHQVTQTSQLGL